MYIYILISPVNMITFYSDQFGTVLRLTLIQSITSLLRSASGLCQIDLSKKVIILAELISYTLLLRKSFGMVLGKP